MTSNRRKWKRFKGCLEKVRFISNENVEQHAEIIDESFGGIAMLVGSMEGLKVGENISLYFEECKFVVTIANIAPQRGGGYRVGAHWKSVQTNHSAEEKLEAVLQTS